MNYWENRFKILENSTYTDTKKAYEEITKVFDKSKKDIQSKIDVWLTRLADNNNVSYEKAKEMLSSKELKEFKWDVEDYIKYGEENGLNQEWMKELENASARHHIDKLTALKTSLQAEYEKIYGKDEEITKKTIENAYINRYNHTAYEIQKGFNIGFNLGEIDHNKLDKIIKKPWASDGSNFSDRIWTKKNQMVDTLYQELTRNLISERPLKEVINTMTQYVDKSVGNAKNVAARLVMTESAFFASEGQKTCFKDLGVEEYEIVATLDDKTSDICQNMDGRHFKMSEYQSGVTAPPFHVWCRSTTAPYFNDEFALTERTARDGNGKTYYVPSDMTYKEWKSKQKSLQKVENNAIMYRHKDNTQRKNINGIEVISKGVYDKLIKPVIKSGGKVIIAEDGDFFDKRLESNNASAMTIGDVLIFKKERTISDVLEETFHYKQNKRKNKKFSDKQYRIMNEIEAKEYLLSENIINKYKIPITETETTKKMFEFYKKRKEELEKNGEWQSEN